MAIVPGHIETPTLNAARAAAVVFQASGKRPRVAALFAADEGPDLPHRAGGQRTEPVGEFRGRAMRWLWSRSGAVLTAAAVLAVVAAGGLVAWRKQVYWAVIEAGNWRQLARSPHPLARDLVAGRFAEGAAAADLAAAHPPDRRFVTGRYVYLIYRSNDLPTGGLVVAARDGRVVGAWLGRMAAGGAWTSLRLFWDLPADARTEAYQEQAPLLAGHLARMAAGQPVAAAAVAGFPAAAVAEAEQAARLGVVHVRSTAPAPPTGGQ